MARRRIILAACVAVVALGTAWWWYADRLTPEEERLVGTWQLQHVEQVSVPPTVSFGRDRRWAWTLRTTTGMRSTITGRWSVRDGRVYLDQEPNPIRRMFRPLLGRLKITVAPVGDYSMTAFDFDGTATYRTTFARAASE
jgi:hypothetical protein